MSRCLVTGGAGFIGSHVVDSIIEAGHEVVIVDDLSGGFLENVNPKAIFVEGNIVDRETVKFLFNYPSYKPFDYVFHLAAYAAEGLSHFIRNYNYTNNIIGSINLINASVNYGVKCFVFTSSIAVYGSQQVPFTEDMTPMPEDPYGIAKYAVELDLQAAHRMFGLNYIIFRPHNVYGERQNIGDPYRNVVGIFMNQCLKGEPLTIFGDGEQRRAFTHVSDVAPLIAESIEFKTAYSQTFNIGSSFHPTTINELATNVQRVMVVPSERRVYLPARREVLDASPAHVKARRYFNALGESQVPLAEGLPLMADWVKSHGPRTSHPFSNIEISKELPPSWKSLIR
jgi:UDP-glucose 4-epimerase